MTFLEQYESPVRLSVFLGVFAVMAVLEMILPRKARVQPRAERWFTNAAIVVIYTFALRVIFPIIAIGVALWLSNKGWGVLNWVALPLWIEVVIAVVLLDMAIYWQHVASHVFPPLWQVHRMHHADRDIDVTTGLRFHPIEIMLSMLYKMVLVLILGPSAVAVFIFELLLNGSAMFNHANVKLPLGLDRLIRVLFVTPDMHRVHHSVVVAETNSNYGFFMSVWDRIFGTYIAQPKAGHDGMLIGLSEFQTKDPATLLWCLKLPFMTASPNVASEASAPSTIADIPAPNVTSEKESL